MTLIMKKSRTIRILVIGDQGVGKTTFISTLISESPDHVEHVLRPVLLPPNMCVVAPNIFTELIDTAEGSDFETEIENASIILLVFDMSDEATIESLSEKWLPLVQLHNHSIPVVLVGNKKDKPELKDSMTYKPIREVIKLVLKRFKQVEMGLECSAYYNQYVSEVLNAAHQAVIYPLKPIYDIANKTITLKLKQALTRIFRILDKDIDGVLSDKEMSNLQEVVFGSQLDIDDLNRIRELIKIELQDYNLKEIKLNGFIALQKKCIELLNIQICWGILRAFGYNDQLEISPKNNSLIMREDLGASIQLKAPPISFLTQLFNYYSKLHDSKQTSQELINDIFFPADQVLIPQFRNVSRNVDITEFILAWHFFAYTDYIGCSEALRKIGYDRDLEETFSVTSEKVAWKDIKRVDKRRVISIGVLESKAYGNYIQSLFPFDLFYKGIHCSHNIFSTDESSKIIILFKLNKNNVSVFRDHQRQKMLDMFVYLESDQEDAKEVYEMLDLTTIQKRISQQEQEKTLEISKLSQLDLDQFPIKYKKSNTNKFFNLVWDTLEHIDKQFDPETILKIKAVEKNESNLVLPLIVGGLTVVAAYLTFRSLKNKH